MATVQTAAGVFVNGFDLAAYLTSVEPTIEQDVLDNTSLAVSGASRTYQPGLNTRSIKADGFYAYNSSNDALSIDKIFADALSVSAHPLMTFSSAAPAIGGLAMIFNTVEASYDIKAMIGELLKISFEAKATDQTSYSDYARGLWLMSQTVTGAVNGTTYDNSATSTGWFAQVHNTDSDGTATVKVQHSTNGSSWSDLITFGGAISSLSAAQSVDTTTSVNRYVRAIVTAIGGTTNKVSVAMKIGYTG